MIVHGLSVNVSAFCRFHRIQRNVFVFKGKFALEVDGVIVQERSETYFHNPYIFCRKENDKVISFLLISTQITGCTFFINAR